MKVLIDNDKLIQLSWKIRSETAGVSLNIFSNTEDFLDLSSNFDKSTDIYIDSDLDNGLKGEIESKKIANLGFKNIWLCTGYTDLPTHDFLWLKGKISKTPPF